ncbi:hypothetical protein [Pseudomonas sp. RIT-PI-AD]|uniref:hypothetical protein n=1 Tax=Pseudomonas sp. RIT-PI-AD TaxID=3035294 RepID=UPI0021D86165|nr:hypothetical protein [Pseudomonas sp. RIT-PI-AD]
MPRITLNYRFRDEPRRHTLDFDEARPAPHRLAYRLILLHYADAENSLLIPSADDSPEAILEQAEVLEITDIRGQAESGETPPA